MEACPREISVQGPACHPGHVHVRKNVCARAHIAFVCMCMSGWCIHVSPEYVYVCRCGRVHVHVNTDTWLCVWARLVWCTFT